MHRLARAAAGLVLAAATACSGNAGDDAGDGGGAAARVVPVTMTDLKFDPATLSVAKGEKVTFRFTNAGQVAHDAFVGDAQAQQEHEKEAGDSGHDHGASGGDAVTVQPGKTGELTHTFSESGTVEVGCHQPGHYAAGMKITVTVA